MAKRKKKQATPKGGGLFALSLTPEQAASVGVPTARAEDIARLGANAETHAELVAVVESVGYYAEKADHLIAAGATVEPSEPDPPELVAVPAINGLSGAAAEVSLNAVGLFGVPTDENSSTVTAGEVFGQDPADGVEVDVGSTVTYSISLGPVQTIVPDVEGMTELTASTKAAEADLVPESIHENSDYVALGETYAQDPARGTTVDVGSTLTFRVSDGPGQTTVPNIEGVDEGQAAMTITVEGLVGSPTTAFHESYAVGICFDQSPAAGTDVIRGTTVTYSVSDGPQPYVPTMVDVPLLNSKTDTEAKALLAAANLIGFETVEENDDVVQGYVFAQDPTEGTSVEEGSTVAYTTSSGPIMVSMPDVVGEPKDDAIATVQAINMNVSMQYAYRDDQPEEYVYAQDPLADTEMVLNDEKVATLSISAGQDPSVVVPNVVGMLQSEAVARLESDGLIVQSFEGSDDLAEGFVYSQAPAHGTTVSRGDTVSVYESTGPAQPVEVKMPVPLVDGQTSNQAASILMAQGFVGVPTNEHSDTVPQGICFGQNPAANTPANLNTNVYYRVSLGDMVKAKKKKKRNRKA